MAEVRVQEGESIENALRRFKRKVQTEDIIKEVKRHSLPIDLFYFSFPRRQEGFHPCAVAGWAAFKQLCTFICAG